MIPKIKHEDRGSYGIPKSSFQIDKSIGTKITLLRPMMEEKLMIMRPLWMRIEY